MNFTINRSTWLTAEVAAKLDIDSKLLNDSDDEHKGLMCCLGSMCKQLGVKASSMAYISSPANIAGEAMVPTIGIFTNEDLSNNGLTQAAMSINDRDVYSRAAREHALTQLFLSHGHIITFTGEYPSWLGEESVD